MVTATISVTRISYLSRWIFDSCRITRYCGSDAYARKTIQGETPANRRSWSRGGGGDWERICRIMVYGPHPNHTAHLTFLTYSQRKLFVSVRAFQLTRNPCWGGVARGRTQGYTHIPRHIREYAIMRRGQAHCNGIYCVVVSTTSWLYQDRIWISTCAGLYTVILGIHFHVEDIVVIKTIVLAPNTARLTFTLREAWQII